MVINKKSVFIESCWELKRFFAKERKKMELSFLILCLGIERNTIL